jgi:hypothetical protein
MPTKTFEMNGNAYQTDTATLELLRSLVPSAKLTGDSSAVQAVMLLGLQHGRIRQIANVNQPNP